MRRVFRYPGVTLQFVEIAAFVPLIFFGLSRMGAYMLKKVEGEEDAHFVVVLILMAVAAVPRSNGQPAGYRRGIPGWTRGKRRGSRQACSREVTFLRKISIHPEFLCRDRFLDRSD